MKDAIAKNGRIKITLFILLLSANASWNLIFSFGKRDRTVTNDVLVDVQDVRQSSASNLRVPSILSNESATRAEEPSTNAIVSNVSTGPEQSEFDPANYAYAFVIGGCNPEDGKYRGFLYNAIVSARILREEGSRVDVVVLLQLSNKVNATELPEDDIRFLTQGGVKVEYIPKTEGESFYDTVMNKFRILALTQYRRVLLMDGDVMPLGSLDYLFRMSDGKDAILKENVVIMGTVEPANGGFFMLAPGKGEYERITEIIRTREIKAASLTTWPKFDEIDGWGHVIEDDDPWEARHGGGGTKWNFHFAFSDQGLLYHWTKYEKRSVSVISGRGGHDQTVQNWGVNVTSGKVVREARYTTPFNETSKPRFQSYILCAKYMCDFHHATGAHKPWLLTPPADLGSANFTTNYDATRVWWSTLYALNNEIAELNLNFTNWQHNKKPPLGMYATFHDVERRIAKRNEETNQTISDKQVNSP